MTFTIIIICLCYSLRTMAQQMCTNSHQAAFCPEAKCCNSLGKCAEIQNDCFIDSLELTCEKSDCSYCCFYDTEQAYCGGIKDCYIRLMGFIVIYLGVTSILLYKFVIRFNMRISRQKKIDFNQAEDYQMKDFTKELNGIDGLAQEKFQNYSHQTSQLTRDSLEREYPFQKYPNNN